MVQPLGYSVSMCNDPTRAVETFIELKPQVVMLDMHMPEKDGIEVLDEILLTGIPTKVILVSGYVSSFIERAKEIAAFHENSNVVSLAKPFRAGELADVLSRLTAQQPD
jgi:CheY-like chemotaxis protein